jgi:TolB protein
MFSRSLTGSVSLALLVVVAAAGVFAAAGSARAPGKNGPIAFRRYFDDQQTWGAVFTMQPDGSQVRQVTHPAKGVLNDQPAWAPDGSLIAFTRFASNENLDHIWTVAPDGSGLAPVGPLCPPSAHEQTCADEAHASFSPDSKRLVLVESTGVVKQVPITGQQIEHSAIAVMNRDGSGNHVIYTTNGFAADLDYPTFSPDGTRIVFERHNSGLSKPADKHAVFVIGVDGSNPRRLTPWAENDGDNPDWSPDGKWIIYHSYLDDPSGQSQYFLVHPDGTGRKQITHFGRGTHLASASFSPDGSSIAFSKGPEGGNIDVFTMHVDGTHVRRLTKSKLWDSAPDWGPARK